MVRTLVEQVTAMERGRVKKDGIVCSRVHFMGRERLSVEVYGRRTRGMKCLVAGILHGPGRQSHPRL